MLTRAEGPAGGAASGGPRGAERTASGLPAFGMSRYGPDKAPATRERAPWGCSRRQALLAILTERDLRDGTLVVRSRGTLLAEELLDLGDQVRGGRELPGLGSLRLILLEVLGLELLHVGRHLGILG